MTTEQSLIRRAQDGDLEAFHTLVEGARNSVYLLAFNMTGNRHDAEDLSQEVFIKVYRSLKTFRGDSAWRTWLYRITVNTCHDHHKTKKGIMTGYSDEVQETAYSEHPDPLPDRSAEAGLIRGHILRALDALTPSERSVFVLRHYQDLSLKQISDTLNIAEGTVKSHLFRAVQRLQKELSFYRQELG